MKKQRKIKNFLIYPKFQLVLIGVNSLFMVLAFVFAYIGVSSGFDTLRQVGVDAKVSSTHPFFNYIDLQQAFILKYLAIALAAALVITMIFSLVFSHRVVGPITKLKNDLKRVADGEDLTFKFRKNDFFKELPELINKIIKKK